MKNELTRSPEIIAAEINSIKAQTQKIMLQASIEIGRRLAEAKEAVGHGNWINWLQQSVAYSDRTAANLMRIFNEYGNGQERLFGQSNQQAFAELSYTQAIALLGIRDEDERAEFIKENNINDMSTRELEKAIKERDQAKKEAEQATKRAEKLSGDLLAEKEAKKTAENTVTSLEKQLAEAKPQDIEKINQLKKELADKKATIKDLNEKLNAPIEAAVVEKIPEETEQELFSLRKELETLKSTPAQEAATMEFRIHFESVKDDFNKLLDAVNKIECPETQEKYKNAVGKMLDAMKNTL